MPSYNRVVLVGNLTADPSLRYTPQGKAVCDFDLAMNHQFKNPAGQEQKEATFVPVTVWGKQAELVAQYLKKGRQCLIDGPIRQEKWTNKEGHKRSRLKIVGMRVLFLGSPQKKEEPQPEPVDEPAQV